MARRLALSLLLVLLIVAVCAADMVWRHGAELAALNAFDRLWRRPPGSSFSPPGAARPGPAQAAACSASPGMTAAAAFNAASLAAAPWAVFGRPETGWAVYAPLVSREVDTTCPPDRGGFARALARWQTAHGLPATGRMSAETLRAMDLVWLARRPFVSATRMGGCPAPPSDDLLVTARQDEGYGGKVVRLHVRALAAYRRLVAAARSALPGLDADPRLLTIVSGYRPPAEEAAKCATSGACGTVSLARCSAHRTGLALDLFLGAGPGFEPTSSDDANRAAQSRSPAYRWLVRNAGQFGFTPYPFEPWHWEYTGPDAHAGP